MTNYKKAYRDLETSVMHQLRHLINHSEYISKHTNTKALKVSLFDYQELTVIHDKLTFLDKFGLEYSLFAEANLEDLIDILSENGIMKPLF